MRRLCCCLLCLALPAAAVAQGGPEKPFLVLDAGGHTAMVRQVLFTPDGKELITVSDDKTVRFWDVASGEPLRTLRPPIGHGVSGMLGAAALSPDGKTLAVGGYTATATAIYLIALPAGRIDRVLKGHTGAINALAFSPDGKRLASGSGDQTARLWDVGSGECTQTLSGHTRPVFAVAFSPDGRRLATASLDKTGRLWSLATGRAEAVLRGHDQEVDSIAWSPDGATLATGSYDGSIRLWGADGTPRTRFADLGSAVCSVTFTADSRRLLVTRGLGKSFVCSLLSLAGGKEPVRFTRHNNTVLCGALSPDGTLAATSGGDDHETYVWKTADGAVVSRLASRGRTAWSAAWAPDRRAITWGNTSHYTTDNDRGPLERTFRLPDLEFAPAPDPGSRRAQTARGPVALDRSGPASVAVKRGAETVAELKLGQDYDVVRCFTLLPGDRAAAGAMFGLYLFDTRSGKQVREFRGHTGNVWAVAPSPDGRYLLSASNDQTLRVWDPDRDEPLLSLFVAGDDWVAWTPEGYYAASPGGEKLMGWHVNNGPDRMASFYPAAQFRRSLYRPDVIQRLLEAGSVEKALALADRERGKPSQRTEVREVLPPKVAITAPSGSGLRLDRAEVEVKATAESVGEHPVTGLRLLVDGRPYQGQAGLKRVASPRLGKVEESWAVELSPGRHRLSVQADSAVSQAVSDEVEIVYVEESRPQVELPRLYVLAVGVSDYPGDLKLNYAARDAQAIEQTFRDKSRLMFRQVETRLVTDKDATRSGILKGLSWLRKEMTQRDVAVVFFAGHGQKDADGRFYLLPVDVDTDDLVATGVADDDLKKMLAGLPGRVIALLDACHAGAVGGDRRRAVGGLTDDLVRDLVTDDYGVVVMASAMGREFALESNERRQGYFTLALVEALSGKAANKEGVVYLAALDAYVTDRVKELTGGRQHPVTAKPTSVRSFPLARP
jgi:WD40 repeat protein